MLSHVLTVLRFFPYTEKTVSPYTCAARVVPQSTDVVALVMPFCAGAAQSWSHVAFTYNSMNIKWDSVAYGSLYQLFIQLSISAQRGSLTFEHMSDIGQWTASHETPPLDGNCWHHVWSCAVCSSLILVTT